MAGADFNSVLDELFSPNCPIQGSITGPRDGAIKRVNIRPAMVKGVPVHQFEYIRGNQARHRNLTESEAREELRNLVGSFRQAVLHTPTADLHVIAAGGSVKVKQKPPTRTFAEASHDHPKAHILPDGRPNEFLARLGVMTAGGRVIASKRDKFRQINRFLEMIADVTDHLPRDRPVRVVDFGCGKSYLTFALYHYLHEVRDLDVRIAGLDLKQDVIDHCNTIARDLRYDELQFAVGEIATYSPPEPAVGRSPSFVEGDTRTPVDLVVSLHACDTATDDALAKAVEWGATVILSVPCCQHELNKQLRNPAMQPMLKHGIIRERLTELVTDSARAAILELCGYSVQLLEFISLEHTPKNLLIRAVRQANPRDPSKAAQYCQFADFWRIDPALERALQDRLERRGK